MIREYNVRKKLIVKKENMMEKTIIKDIIMNVRTCLKIKKKSKKSGIII